MLRLHHHIFYKTAPVELLRGPFIPAVFSQNNDQNTIKSKNYFLNLIGIPFQKKWKYLVEYEKSEDTTTDIHFLFQDIF